MNIQGNRTSAVSTMMNLAQQVRLR